MMAVHFDATVFTSLYGMSAGNDKDGSAVKFYSQDSEYRCYIPGKNDGKSKVTGNPDGGLTVTLVQDHIIHAVSHDDHSTTQVTFDKNGKTIAVSSDFQIEDGKPYAIPGWIPKALDIGVELLGALGALETAGISEVAAQEVVADINSICDAFNKFMKVASRLTDDGGRLNFPAVICHDMNKAACSVSA